MQSLCSVNCNKKYLSEENKLPDMYSRYEPVHIDER